MLSAPSSSSCRTRSSHCRRYRQSHRALSSSSSHDSSTQSSPLHVGGSLSWPSCLSHPAPPCLPAQKTRDIFASSRSHVGCDQGGRSATDLILAGYDLHPNHQPSTSCPRARAPRPREPPARPLLAQGVVHMSPGFCVMFKIFEFPLPLTERAATAAAGEPNVARPTLGCLQRLSAKHLLPLLPRPPRWGHPMHVERECLAADQMIERC